MKLIKYILGCCVLFLLLVSCNNFKKTTATKSSDKSSSHTLKSSHQLAFDNIFFNGLKADLITNDPQGAIKEYQQCLMLDDKNHAVLFNLGKLFFQKGRYTEAGKVVEAAVEIQSNNKWYLMLLTQIYRAQKEYDKAIKIQKDLLKLDPEDIAQYYELANIYILMNQPTKAIKAYDEIEKIGGINPDVSEHRKKIYLIINKFDKAVEEINKLIEYFPGETKYLKMLADLYLAHNKEDELLDTYKRILEQDENDGNAQIAIANFYLKTGNETEAVKIIYGAFRNPTLRIEVKLAFIMFNYFQMGMKAEDKDFLLELADILIEVHPENARTYSFRADIYFEQNETDSAIKYYEKALEYEKGIIFIWSKVISMQFDNRKYEDVLSYSIEASEYFPNNPEFYLYQGVSNIQLKEYDKAVKALKEGVDYVLDNRQLLFRFYSSLGEACNGNKEYKPSDNYFDLALEIEPNSTLVMNNYAYYLSLRNTRLDTAEIMSKKTLELRPGSAAYLDTYGWIKFLKGEYEEAKSYIRKALEIKPNDSDLLEHYGDVLYKLKNVEDAKEYWIKAKENGSASETLENKIQEGRLNE